MKPAISPAELKYLLDTGASVTVLDVRLVEDRSPVKHPVPGAVWRDPDEVGSWQEDIGAGSDVVVYCVHGHRVSQRICAALRANGISARYLDGGIEGWQKFVRADAAEDGE